MIITTAESVLDLKVSAPDWVDSKAAICTAQLAHFDIVSGLLQFNTACAASRNTWVQTVMFEDWNSVVTFQQEQPAPLEEEEELVQELPVEEGNFVEGMESWPEVLAKYPELVNMDVKVHCNCPAFLWWGSWYNLEQRDTALFPEGVPYPGVNDPALNNVICKHLAAVFSQHF